ncbi:uncharacterized protein C1orf105 homolog isoform X3 [Myotis yumanensis]|uniref:uncharacterized protein C1orf105 homolog isoform X3 n=1 Tax=Myotis yumanensis TaxID=159337 RepID=UPI0038D4C56E
MSLQASVPKFDRIPWLCEASLRNKPLVLSLPQRYPHGSATSLNSWRKDVNSPNTFQVPNGLSKARRNQRGPMLGRNQQLCSTCQEVRMVQPRMMMIPNDLKHSFENCMSHRMKSLQPPKAQTEPRCSPDDISTVQVGPSPGVSDDCGGEGDR